MKPDDYNGPVPSEGQFRAFLTRLLRVPKDETDALETARVKRPPRVSGATVKKKGDRGG